MRGQNGRMTPTTLRIDFVSDVSCPWCAVGLASLEQALARVAPGIVATLHFQPFELNPAMPPEGEDTMEHLQRKYRIDADQVRANGEALRERAAAAGFAFDPGMRKRIWNTFDAHRLLHWAGLEGGGRQLALKKALLHAYFIDGSSPADPELLVESAEGAGLDGARAAAILANGDYAAEVREQEQRYADAGIRSVPAVIIDGRHLVSGGQPPDVFEGALRRIAAAR
jgi:predicted DsbA family dithiol-disulfide isomerase